FPFAERLLDVLLAAETLDVLPLGIAAPPIGAAADELAWFSFRIVVPLLADGADVDGSLGLALAFDEEQVAGAPFDHLALDAFHPRPGHAIFADAVQQDAAVARGLLALRPGFVAPLEFDDELIVLVFFFRREAAPDFAGDADGAIHDGEDLLRIIVLAVRLLAFLGSDEVGVKVAEVLAVEELDRLGDRIGAGDRGVHADDDGDG